jgi:hypothetical protein
MNTIISAELISHRCAASFDAGIRTAALRDPRSAADGEMRSDFEGFVVRPGPSARYAPRRSIRRVPAADRMSAAEGFRHG